MHAHLTLIGVYIQLEWGGGGLVHTLGLVMQCNTPRFVVIGGEGLDMTLHKAHPQHVEGSICTSTLYYSKMGEGDMAVSSPEREDLVYIECFLGLVSEF